jgi:flagellar hook-associated protein 2
MKLSKTYNSKKVSSSQGNAVTATATTSTANGTYRINVTRLATPAINVSESKIDDPDKAMDIDGDIQFTIYNEDGSENKRTIPVNKEDTLNDILKKINNDDSPVRAFYDAGSKRVIMETTRTGKYNPGNSPEIDFGEDDFFKNALNMGTEQGGTDAVFEYNGIEMTSKNNSYELNGINFQFLNETQGNAALTVTNDTENSFDSIMAFIDKYNEVIDTLNESQREERYRDFPPLTEAQKKEMSEDEIEKWEEKAKSGMLKGESAIKDGMFAMRQSWYANVKTDGAFASLTEIGVTTSNNYLDGGKLIVNEEKLRAALHEDPDSVQKLFSNSGEAPGRGLVNRLEDAVEGTMSKIKQRAGGEGTTTLETFTLGKRMKDLNKRIAAFEERLTKIETRYWSQFTAMEKAISRMNQQSSQLLAQFGDM